MWGQGSEWFWAFLQTLILLISLLAIFRQLRLQHKANITAVLERLSTVWESQDMSQSRLVLLRAKQSQSFSINRKQEGVIKFLEELGIYVRTGIIPGALAWEFFSYEVERYWPVAEPFIQKIREDSNDSTYFSNAEWLYKRLSTMTRWRGGSVFSLTNETIEKFVNDELHDLEAREDG